MHWVTPQLVIGSRDDAANPQLIGEYGIEAVLSMEPVRMIRPIACQMTLQVKDRVALPGEVIEQAVGFIDQQIRLGRRVMAHCQMGISRSPALVIAYLHQHHGISLDQAIDLVRQARPQAEPHPVLIHSLRQHYAHTQKLTQALAS